NEGYSWQFSCMEGRMKTRPCSWPTGLQRLAEMHSLGQQALAKVEALAQGIAQGGVENEVRAALPSCLFAQCIDQLTAQAMATGVGGSHQVVDIEEAPVQQVLLNAVARQTLDLP